jgi:hypothetical protein
MTMREHPACDVCGRPTATLRPFGGPGDPLVGDFSGCRLVKMYRWVDAIEQADVEESWECRDCAVLDHLAAERRLHFRFATPSC